MPECTMSGLLSTTCALPRIARRASDGVSPSYVNTPISRSEPCVDEFGKRMQLRELILRERLRRKQIKRTSRGVLQDRVQHGRVVTERLSRCRWRDRDDVTAGEHVLERLRLVGVELVNAAARQRRTKRSSVPSGYGANEAVSAGKRCAAVTIGSASRPMGAGELVRRDKRVLKQTVFVAGNNGQGRLRHGNC